MTRMPQVTARDLVRFLKSQGFAEHRQSRGLAVRLLKDAGFSVEEFLRLR